MSMHHNLGIVNVHTLSDKKCLLYVINRNDIKERNQRRLRLA